MASKIALNIKSLVALGTQRLAELLVELSTTNPAMKRRNPAMKRRNPAIGVTTYTNPQIE
jgi:hypothetical protein